MYTFVIPVSLKTGQTTERSWLTVSTFAILASLLAIAVFVTIALACHYRRRMKAMQGKQLLHS